MSIDLERRARINAKLDAVMAAYAQWKIAKAAGKLKKEQRERFTYREYAV